MKTIIAALTFLFFVNDLCAQKITVIKDDLSTKIIDTKGTEGEKKFIRNMINKYDPMTPDIRYIETVKSDIPGDGKYKSVKLFDANHRLLKSFSYNKYFQPDTKKEYHYKGPKKAYTLEFSYAPEDGWLQIDSTAGVK